MTTEVPFKTATALAAALLVLSLTPSLGAEETNPCAPTAAPRPATGNGELNWIQTDGARRKGATFTFAKVRIEGNGWLVMHPFKEGKPDGSVYVGATYLPSGESSDVAIEVDRAPETGTMFIVMLHHDVNENREFDFVFVDEVHVLDKAVFENDVMIAHAIAAPAEN